MSDYYNKIVVKKGETYTLKCCCNYGSTDEEEFVASYDLTEKNLDEEAWQFALDTIVPEGTWEKN